ncbi:hypothetical protein Droror1_Dr00027071, partial [Drosera rotundifolia]
MTLSVWWLGRRRGDATCSKKRMHAASGLEANQMLTVRMGMEQGREMKLRTAIMLLLNAIDGVKL